MTKKIVITLVLIPVVLIVLAYAFFITPIFDVVTALAHPVSTPPQAKNIHYGFDNPGNEALGNSYHVSYDFSDSKSDQTLNSQEQYNNILQQIKFYEQDAKNKGGRLYGTDGFTPGGIKIPCQQAEDSYVKYSPFGPNNLITRCFLNYSGFLPVLYIVDFSPAKQTNIWKTLYQP